MKLLLILLWPTLLTSAQDIVFLGEPTKMIALADGEAITKHLSSVQSKEFQCRITRNLNKYQWQSRESVELIRSETGGFIWYTAIDGSGYVKIVKKGGPLDAFQYDYVEHLHVMLGSINYYGKATIIRR